MIKTTDYHLNDEQNVNLQNYVFITSCVMNFIKLDMQNMLV